MRKQYMKVFAYVVLALLLAQFFATVNLAGNTKQTFRSDPNKEIDNNFEFIAYKSNPNFPKNEAKIIEDYGSYALIESSIDDYKELKQKGFVIGRKRTTINTPAGKIDFKKYSMEDENLKIEHREGLFLIKFIGPVKQEWIKETQNKGIDIYETLGANTYIIRGSKDDIDLLSEKSYVDDLLRYDPSLKVSSELKNKGERVDLKINLVKESNRYSLLKDLNSLGGRLLSYNSGSLNYDSAAINISSSKIRYLADDPSIISIYEKPEYKLNNDLSAWVMQSYDKDDKAESVWDKNILGQNQVIGISDTGVDYDHAMFRNSTSEIGEPGPSHRKIVLYRAYADGSEADYSGHGTHVSGSAAGDWKNYGEPDDYDGMAPSAKIAFFDVGNGDSLKLPDDLTTMFQTQYDAGARIFSNSWGSSSSSYTTDSENTDEFMWNHNDALILFANGNSGPNKKTVGSPATAKNIVSVGNCINGISEDMAESSSHGPTDEGRLKPTISAPGTDIISADSDGSQSSMNSGLMHMTGTSMATPTASGLTALVRQYYTEGWFNDGEKDESNGITPSGSLMKATLINSAWNMQGDYTGKSIPSHGQGWGKINLEDALYFKGDKRKLSVLNDGTVNGKSLLDSGDYDEYSLLAEDGEDLKITLTWTDYPGAALQNDLNLVVEAPDGTNYLGNVFQNGHSVQGGNADNINVSEQVYLDESQVQKGRYTVRVVGNTISNAPQKYSLIATGEVSRSAGDVSFVERKYNLPPAEDEATVKLMDLDENSDPSSIDSVDIDVYSTTEGSGESVTVHETGKDTGIFTGTITLGTGNSVEDGVLQVSDGDTLTVEYQDSSHSLYRSSEAVIDTSKPTLEDITYPSIEENNILSDAYEIDWKTDEKTYGSLYYGKTRHLDKVERWRDPSFNHNTVLKDLEPNTTYYFKIIASDATKTPNLSIFDNDGALYTFKTPSTAGSMGEGYSGYTYSVSNGTDQDSIFDRDVMYAGYYYTMTFFGTKEGHFDGAIMFDTSAIKDIEISEAAFRLFPKSKHMPTYESESWTFEVLSDNIESAFPDPSYTTLREAEVQFSVDSITGSNLADADEVDSINVDSSDLTSLENNIADGKLVLRMRLPNKTKHIDMNGWYTGHQIKRDSFIFKKPSLVVETSYKENGFIEFDRDSYSVDDFANVRVEDDGLNSDSETFDTVEATVTSSSDSKKVQLLETGEDTAIFTGHIELSDTDSSESLLVNDGNTISVSYIDSLDDMVSDESLIEVDSPSISNLDLTPKNDLTCKVTWDTDEPTTSLVKYGNTQVLTREKYDDDYKTHHEVTLTGLVKDTQYNIEVTGFDEASNSIDNSNIQQFTTPDTNIQPSILVIEDAGSADNYRSALENNGYDYTFEHVSDTGLPSSNLKNYDITVWIVDGFSDTLTLDERNLIKDYLQNGGNLYINGEDIGYDIGDSNFYIDYLHSNYIQGYSDSSIINGLSGNPISDSLSNLDIGGKYADVIEPMGEYSSVVFNYGTGSTAGIKAQTSEYKLVYMGCEYFEGPDTQSNKDILMENIVSWMDPNQIDDVGPAIGIVDRPSDQVYINDTIVIEGRADEFVTGGSDISCIEYYHDLADSPNQGYICQPEDGQYDSKQEDTVLNIDGVDLGVGKHVVYLRGKDTSGNWGSYEKVTFEVLESSGTINPSVQIVSPDEGSILSKDSVEVQWTGESAWYEIKMNSGDWEDVGSSNVKTYSGLTDGTHSVYVRAYNDDNQYREDSVSFSVDTTIPEAKVGLDRTVLTNEEVIFDGSSSTDNLEISEYTWDIKGTNYNGKVVNYSFTNEGVYQITLTVMDQAGNTDSDTVNITVETPNNPPDADAGSDRTVSIGEIVTFDGSGSTDDDGISNHTWSIENKKYYGITVEHRFSDIGTYEVSLEVTDTDGYSDTDTVNITVEDSESPTADAGEDKTSDMGETVTFDAGGSTDNHVITVYRWNLEGEYKYGSTVEHSFSEAGEHQATLKVTDESGNSDTDTVNVSVIDTEKPVADAGMDKTAQVNKEITFDGSGSSDNVGIESYTWIIEETSYPGKTITYTFDHEGEYVITLNVSDAEGNFDTDTVNVTVSSIDQPPTADAGEDKTVSYGEQFTLNASSSKDDDGIKNYTWYFGEELLYGKTSTYTLEGLGTHTFTLEVTDAKGQSDLDTVNITVIDDEKPTADAGDNRTVNEDTLVSFDGSDSKDNVAIQNYTWQIEGLTYFEQNITHVFETPGTYTVILEVKDSSGNSDTDSIKIEVEDITDPIADAGDDKTVNEDTQITFDGSGSSDNVAIKTYTWNIEGTDYVGQSVDHQFDDPGTYSITLTVIDSSGNTGKDNITVKVEDITSPKADAGKGMNITIGDEIVFDAGNSTDNVGITNYTWTIGSKEYYGQTIKHSFKSTGEYTISLTVKDKAGNSDIDSITIVVKEKLDTTDPVADAGVDRTVYTGEEVSFDGSSSYDDEEITIYYWDFDDGNTTTGMNVKHTYENTGYYQVSLKVEDAAGNNDFDTVNITVENRPSTLEADAGENRTVDVNENISLSASNSSSNYNIINFEWKIGSDMYTGEVVRYTYTKPGNYFVELTVTDESGAKDTDTVQIEVVDGIHPEAVIDVNEIVQLGKPVMISGEQSTDNVQIQSYKWTIDKRDYYGSTIEYTFNKPGREQIELTVKDTSGNTDVETFKVLVKDKKKPKANAGDDITTLTDSQTTLDGSDSTDNYKIQNYTWIIEGNEYYGKNVQYNFTEAGNYTVELLVEDTSGNVDTDKINVMVKDKEEVPGYPILVMILAVILSLLLIWKRKRR